MGAWHSVQNEGGGKVVCTAYTFYRSIDVQISNTRLSYVLPKHIILSGEREEGKKEEFELSSMLRRDRYTIFL